MTCRLLLISGSLRRASTNTAVLRSGSRLAPDGVEVRLYDGLGRLPHFNPDDDAEPLDPGVARLRAAVRDATALLISTPEYAGALPGSFKNLLDWTIGDDQPGSIYNKPVAWINTSSRGARGAHEELRTVLGYAHAAIVAPACLHVPITGQMVGEDGLVGAESVRSEIARGLRTLVAHAITGADQRAV
jgi:chromate reductase, NAD(P)H dehydrogenase (quinone)